MATPILYTSGIHHVSLSMPGKKSQILEGIGKPGNCNFLIPTIEYIIQCAVSGDLGIADSIKKAKSMQNLNMCSSPETFKILSGLLGVSVENPDQYRKNGKYKIPKSAVKLGGGTGSTSPSVEGAGLKMIEQTAVKSALEQYKPFIEVAKLLIGHLVQIEDVIARVAALSIKSQKPKGNSGGSGRPKALGYQGGADMKNAISKMNSLQGKIDAKSAKMTAKFNNASGASASSTPPDSNQLNSTSDPKTNPNPIDGTYDYKIISTVYSTGVFKEGVDYQYEYIDIPSDDDNIDVDSLDGNGDGPFDVDDNDPYKGKRPKTIILGIYDSKGNDISPTGLITSFSIDSLTGQVVQGQPIDVDINDGVQSLQKADWILRTGRWFGSFSPSMGSGGGTVLYVWKKGGSFKYQVTNPDNYDPTNYDVGWKQQFYTSSDENGIRSIGDEPTDSATGEANSPVLYFSKSELDNYTLLFEDIIDRKFAKSKDLSDTEKSTYKAKIMSQFDPQLFLENMTQNSFFLDCKNIGLLSSNGSPVSIPGLNYAYRPRKINISGEDIWIDPEADYDMKIIQIDPSSKIKFSDDTAQGAPQVEAEILRFVKNTIEISVGTQSFDVDIIRKSNINANWEPYIVFQTPTPGRYESINQFTIDNWQYRDPDNNLITPNEERFINMNTLLRITSNIPTQYWSSKTSNEWKIGTDNYILGQSNGGWKLGRYIDSVSSSQEIKPWKYNNPIIIDINDPIVTKIKVQDTYQYSDTNKNDVITGWYINGIWTNTPPISWATSSVSGQKVSILKYEVASGTSSFTGVPDPGQSFTVVGVGYDIYALSYIDNNVLVNNFHLKKSSVSLLRTFQQITYDQDSSEFSSTGLSIGGKFSLLDGTNAYFNRNTNMLLKWEYLYFDSNDAISIPFMPINIGEKRTWSLNYSLVGNYATQYPLTTISSVIPPNQIRLKESNNPFGRLLDPRKITNSHLAEDNPLSTKYSNGFYGHSSSDGKQQIERLFRYMKSEYDTETYYIVEGVLADDNDSAPPGSAGSVGAGGSAPDAGGGNYGKAHSLGAIKVFLSMLSDIFSKLMPAINKLIELFKNPPSFITSIITEKLGESSTIFSADFLKSYQQMKGITNPIKRKEFAKLNLGEYVYVNPINGDYKVLFDGAAIHKLGPLFGKSLTFGIEVKKMIPKLIFKLDLASATTNSLESVLDGTAKSNNLSSINSNSSSGSTSKIPGSNGVHSNQITTKIVDGEEVSVTYSTGRYIQGVDYQYFYVTENVSRLIKEGDNLVDSGDPDQINLAFGKYDEALRQDPNNQLIKDRISELMVKSPNYTQPIMDLLLSLVCGPLDLVASVVQFIMDFFTHLKFSKLLTDIPKFLSFAWLVKKGDYSWSSIKDDGGKSGGFFTPAVIFKTFGLDVLPIPGINDDAFSLLSSLLSGNIPDSPNLPKTIPPNMPVRNGSIDVNKFISFSFAPFMKRPTVPNSTSPMGVSSITKDHILTFLKINPNISYDKYKLIAIPPFIELIAQFICFIESVINAIIDLFWSILGLEALIPPPHIKLCKKFIANNMDDKSMDALLSGGYNDTNKEAEPNSNYFTGETLDKEVEKEYDFIYEVKTSDGKDIKDLNREELDKWLKDNGNYDPDFLFNYLKQ